MVRQKAWHKKSTGHRSGLLFRVGPLPSGITQPNSQPGASQPSQAHSSNPSLPPEVLSPPPGGHGWLHEGRRRPRPDALPPAPPVPPEPSRAWMGVSPPLLKNINKNKRCVVVMERVTLSIGGIGSEPPLFQRPLGVNDWDGGRGPSTCMPPACHTRGGILQVPGSNSTAGRRRPPPLASDQAPRLSREVHAVKEGVGSDTPSPPPILVVGFQRTKAPRDASTLVRVIGESGLWSWIRTACCLMRIMPSREVRLGNLGSGHGSGRSIGFGP